MTVPYLARRWWRVAVVAVLGAVLAFASSYLVSPTYQSSTRLVIHGYDAGFMSSDGQDPTTTSPLIDATQAKALADTYGSIATSRSLAITVVDKLHLDAPDTDNGFLHDLAGVAAWTYRCTRAVVTSGFCAAVDQREKAISEVQQGTTALQIGTTAGDSAGQPGAYVLEITAGGNTPTKAQRVTDAVADALVQASADQVSAAASTYADRLSTQLDQARADVTTKAKAVTDYEVANNVSEADQQLVVTATAYSNLQAALTTAQADLVDAQANLASIQGSLASTSSGTTSDQQISTGRSSTSVTTNGSNPVYDDLLTQQSEQQATVAGLQARIQTLTQQVTAGSPTALSGPLAQLGSLQTDLTSAQDLQTTLTGKLQDARTQAATAAPDLSRIDTAGKSAYPVSPKRYLYLVIGLLVGGLAGGGLTWLARRRDPVDGGPVDAPDDDLIGFDDVTDRPTEILPVDGDHAADPTHRQLEPVGASRNGHSEAPPIGRPG